MCPSGRNESPMMMVVNESSKSPLLVDDNKRMGGNVVAIEDTREVPANNDVVVEGCDEERLYPTRG